MTMSTVRVETRYGRLVGERAAGVCVFRGIPFAEPPVGELRFRPPRPPRPWAGDREALVFGPAAPQISNDPFVAALQDAPRAWAEDSLTLNVWTPAPGRGRRPVLVFVHGGSFLRGAASWPAYDGTQLARAGDAVVVTVQYRLGVLGLAWLREIAPDPAAWPANLGLRDQIAALEWVRDCIEAFGGDPANVTLFGHSAGAISVGVLLGVPAARGLFRRAILQSGPPIAVSPAGARPVTERLLAAVGLGGHDLERLRALPVERLLAAGAECTGAPGVRPLGLPFVPVRDDDLVPEDPLAAAAAGGETAVPVLIGTTRDEMTPLLVVEPALAGLDRAGVVARCERLLAERALTGAPLPRQGARELVELYEDTRAARGRRTDPWAVWTAILADALVRHPSMHLAGRRARRQPHTYAYLFAWESPFLDGLLGACHMLDVPFVFGTLGHGHTRLFTGEGPAADALARRMQAAWLAFARTDCPADAGTGSWPGYDEAARQTMVLGAGCGVERAPDEETRAVWDGARGAVPAR